MSQNLGLIIESLVAVLLVATIGYCLLLNSRLKRFKADEQSLRATIAELITATEIAERAIAGLKLTVRDCDQNIGERLRSAERFSSIMADQLEAGDEILKRLAQITLAARPQSQTPVPAAADARSLAAQASAIAERSRSRVNGLAA